MTDQSDVDALLASLSEPAKQPSDGKTKGSAQTELESFGERAGSFKIDPRDSHITGTDKLRKDVDSLSVNPEDFTDHLELQREGRKRRTLLLTLGILLFIMALGGVGWSIIQNAQAQANLVIPTDNTEEQRFLNLFPNAPAADTTKSTSLIVTDTGLQIKDGYSLTFAGMDFSSLDYEAVGAGAFGPAAIAKVEGDWNGTAVYLFKDMAHSKAFSKAWDGSEATVEGAAASAVMFMELSTGVHAVLAIVNPDSTGFMIVLPQNLNYESAVNLQNFVRIEKLAPYSATNSGSQAVLATPANFGNVCTPSYNLELNEFFQKETENTAAVNIVRVPWGQDMLYGMKFPNGDEGFFTTFSGNLLAAGENSQKILDSFIADGFVEKSLVQEDMATVQSSDAFTTLVSCMDILNTPEPESNSR